MSVLDATLATGGDLTLDAVEAQARAVSGCQALQPARRLRSSPRCRYAIETSSGMPRIAMRVPHRFLLLSALAIAPGVAQAEDAPKPFPPCEKTPTEGDVAGAKGAFQAGQASFEEGDYNRAISYWDDAYRRDCTAHALLLNLARAHELNNQKRHAVVALETYLARQPSSPQRDQIARRIEGLNEKIAQEAGAAGQGDRRWPTSSSRASPNSTS